MAAIHIKGTLPVKKTAMAEKEEYRVLQDAANKINRPGFSERLHHFIDQVVGLDIPGSEERGRLAAISKITGHSKPSVSEWFKKDKLPSDDIFSALVRFFLQFIDCYESPIKVESWLRYGEEATADPFAQSPVNVNRERSKDLALELLTIVVRDDKVSVEATDLDGVLEDTIKMIGDYSLNEMTSAEAMPELIFSLIRGFIKNRKRAG